MATTTGKKEYTIKINGVTQGITDVTNLEKAIASLDATTTKNVNVTAQATTASKTQQKALTDEEKAAAKLAATKAKLASADSQANKEQIAATTALRDRTKEVTRAVIQDGLESDSVKAMGMQLTDLRNQYDSLSASQRNNADNGGKLLTQIQSLDSEYKALKESTGDFRDSVGDYKKGIAGLEDLSRGLDRVGTGTTALSANVVGSNAVLDAFGDTSEAVAKTSTGLYGVLATAALAQEAYNSVVKEGVIQNTAAAVVDGVRAIQAKAVAASVALEGEATVGATVAQAAFNLVAAANPYVLLAIALVAVVGAIVAFATSTDKSAQNQKQANDIMAITLDELDEYATKLKTVYDIQTQQAQAALDVANAQADGSVAGIKRIRDAEDNLMKARVLNNAANRGFYAEEIDDLEKNKKSVENLEQELHALQLAKINGDSKAWIVIDGKIANPKIDDAITAIQGEIDNFNKKIQFASTITTDQAQIKADAATTAATRKKADEDLAKDQRAAQLSDLRALQDDQEKSVKDTYTERRALIKQANDREIQDLQIRLQTDKTLTDASRQSIEKNIVALKKATTKELHDEDLNRQASELQSARDVIDSRTALIQGADAREEAQININFDRETHDLQNKLKNDTTLTISQQDYITEQIKNIQVQRDRELAALHAASLQEQASTELSELEDNLAAQKDVATRFTNQVQQRSKGGLQLIDVKATQTAAAQSNAALNTYMGGLNKYQQALDAAHNATISTLQQGTPEYTAELDKYAKATEDTTKKLGAASAEQKENTRTSQQAQVDYYKDAAQKISGIVSETVTIFQQGTQILSDSVQGQIDALNASLDAVNTKYAAATDLQQKAVQAVQDTEQQLQDATGGTADALKEQLADQMRARNEDARQQQQLAKQQQKLQDDIAKKQKEAQKITLLSNIAGALASGAQAVVTALAAYPPPFSYVAAAVTGSLAAIQVGIMTKQLAKLATGGEIIGNGHGSGGVNLGSQYEVEGGEFVVNKAAFSNNADLVRFINESTGAVSASDLIGLVPGGSPLAVSDAARSSNADVIEAIDGIDMHPVVAVTDINSVNDQLTAVRELSGF